MIGSIIGAGLGAAASIFGGVKASQAMKKVEKNIKQQQQDNQDWFTRRYNEDATQRADAQRALAMTEESIRNRNRQAASTQAVMGGTDESVQSAMQANALALSDTAGQIAASADARKDNIEQQFMAKKDNLNNQLNDLQQKKAQAISQAAQGAASAMGKMGGATDNLLRTFGSKLGGTKEG